MLRSPAAVPFFLRGLPRAPLFSAAVLVAWTAAVALAQAPAAQSGGDPPGEKYALLVGVRNYDRNELRNLKYPEADVEGLAGILRRSGYRRVVLMTQKLGAEDQRFLPTADRIRTSLEAIVANREPGDTVLVAFAGHGVQFQGNEEVYFCPMDAKLGKRTTLVSLTDVYRSLEGCRAGTRLLLADACRNDPRSDHSRSRAEVDLESVTRPQRRKPPGGVAAFFSCSAGEKSFESPQLGHGVFFHYLLEGLSGRADGDSDGRVDLDELVAFTRRQVTDHVNDEFGDDQSQLPELVGRIRGAVTLGRVLPPPKSEKETSPGVVVIGPSRPREAPKNDLLNELVPFEHLAGIAPGRTMTRQVRDLFGPPEATSPGPRPETEIWTWTSKGVSAAVYTDHSAPVSFVYVESPYAGAAKNGLRLGMSEKEARSTLLREHHLARFDRGNDGSTLQVYAPSRAKAEQETFQVWYRAGKLIRMKLFER